MLLYSNMLYAGAEPANIWTVNIHCQSCTWWLPKCWAHVWLHSLIARALNYDSISEKSLGLWLQLWFSSLEHSLPKGKKENSSKKKSHTDRIWHTTLNEEVNSLSTFTLQQSSVTWLVGTTYSLSHASGAKFCSPCRTMQTRMNSTNFSGTHLV